MSLVYLAGPITGLTYDGGANWRNDAKARLAAYGIQALSPLRAKEYLRSTDAPLSGTGEEYAHMGVLSTSRGVMTRDRFDATRCDVLFVNLLGATQVSVGTVMEIAWADLKRTPIVCAIEPKGNPHDHMMISEAIGFRVESIEQAIATTIAVIGAEILPPARVITCKDQSECTRWKCQVAGRCARQEVQP